MRSLFVPARSAGVAPIRMAWLPGAYHAGQDFVAAGFAAAVRARRAALDLVFADLELVNTLDLGSNCSVVPACWIAIFPNRQISETNPP